MDFLATLLCWVIGTVVALPIAAFIFVRPTQWRHSRARFTWVPVRQLQPIRNDRAERYRAGVTR